MKTISMSVWRRPEYTRRVLAALRNNHGSENYRLVVAVDAIDNDGNAHRKVLEVVERQTWPAEVVIVRLPVPSGANGTIKAALDVAFADGEFVIHVEDDILLAQDALSWFEWAGKRHRHDPQVWTIGAWRHADGWQPDSGRGLLPNEAAMCRREAFFNCWGWGMWADRWAEMAPRWTTTGDFELSWDTRVHEVRGSRVQVCPMISRAINIGAELGTHRGDLILPYWRGNCPTPGREFFET